MKENNVAEEYLRDIKVSFEKYKSMGDKTFEQLNEEDFHLRIDDSSNSIAIIIQHIGGNLISRFTDFLTSDGEKPTRFRDTEFEEQSLSKTELLKKWNDGWNILLSTLVNLNASDLLKIVYIRKQPHTVIEALNRSLTHISYHVGQIVFMAKHIKKNDWKTLSIPKGKSEEYNKNYSS